MEGGVVGHLNDQPLLYSGQAVLVLGLQGLQLVDVPLLVAALLEKSGGTDQKPAQAMKITTVI